MDQERTGGLIRQFRKKLGLTQKQLAERINVSDKAVSKWERGSGYPDISLLTALSEVFGTDINVLLTGELEKNETEKGNMKNLRFYVCRGCGNIIAASSEASVSCCGNRLIPLKARQAEESERLKTEDLGGEWYITSDHSMTKENYISFAAYVSDNSVMIFRQYPEWAFQLYLPMYRTGRLVWYSTDSGLLWQDIATK